MSSEEIVIEEKIISYLLILRINPSLKGFRYFKEGVKKIIEEPSKKFNVHKKLYKELCEGESGKDELVDRAMRHAIEVSLKKNGISEFEKKTHVSFNYKPTPRELLSLLAEKVLMDVRDLEMNKNEYDLD